MPILNLYLLGYWFNEYLSDRPVDHDQVIEDALKFFGNAEWISPEFITYKEVIL